MLNQRKNFWVYWLPEIEDRYPLVERGVSFRPLRDFQPHTCPIQRAILTFSRIIFLIQGCSSISFGVGLSAPSWIRLIEKVCKWLKSGCCFENKLHVRVPNKIFHLRCPCYGWLGFIFELRWLKMPVNMHEMAKGSFTSAVLIIKITSIGGKSLGNGNLFCTSSSSEIPADHTSDRTLYSPPAILSGCSVLF